MTIQGSQQSAVSIIWEEPGVGITLAHGRTKPADNEVGYAPGAIFLVTGGTPSAGAIIYENVGTKAAANFDALKGAAIANYLPLAGGTMTDAANIAVGSTTGSKIGTAASQKLGFFGATPVVQQSKVADPTGGATQDAEARTAIAAVIDVLEALGFSATS